MTTLADDLAAARALLKKGAKWQTLLPPQWTVQQREDFMQMAGGLLTGADTYVAYKLLERFVTELERLQEEHEEHEQSFNLFHRASIALMHAYKAAHPDVPDLVLPDTTQVNVWAAAELTRLMRENHHLKTEKRQQLQLLTAIREMADSATGTNRTAGDQREPGALGAVKHLIEQFKARHENVMSSPMASGLLLSLKAECEAQHARAERAEAELEAERLAHQETRGTVAALKQESEALRAQFASFADQLQATAISAETGARDWGHMRLHVVAVLSTLESTARKMAAGQPAYVPFYKKRAEAAEADLQRLRDGLAALERKMRDTPDSTSQYWLKRLQSLLTQSHGAQT